MYLDLQKHQGISTSLTFHGLYLTFSPLYVLPKPPGGLLAFVQQIHWLSVISDMLCCMSCESMKRSSPWALNHDTVLSNKQCSNPTGCWVGFFFFLIPLTGTGEDKHRMNVWIQKHFSEFGPQLCLPFNLVGLVFCLFVCLFCNF